MALDMGKDKIRVNSISPAWIWSPEVSKIDPQGRHIVNIVQGQLISECLFGVFNFQKKTMQKFDEFLL